MKSKFWSNYQKIWKIPLIRKLGRVLISMNLFFHSNTFPTRCLKTLLSKAVTTTQLKSFIPGNSHLKENISQIHHDYNVWTTVKSHICKFFITVIRNLNNKIIQPKNFVSFELVAFQLSSKCKNPEDILRQST